MAQSDTLILGSGVWPFVFLFVGGYLATEPWRYMGVALSKQLSADSEILTWVRAVSTALVAGLVMRLILFPPGALADVALWLRLAGLAAAFAGFYAGGQVLGPGLVAGLGVLYGGQLLFGG